MTVHYVLRVQTFHSSTSIYIKHVSHGLSNCQLHCYKLALHRKERVFGVDMNTVDFRSFNDTTAIAFIIVVPS